MNLEDDRPDWTSLAWIFPKCSGKPVGLGAREWHLNCAEKALLNLDNIILHERGQSQKNIYCRIQFRGNV